MLPNVAQQITDWMQAHVRGQIASAVNQQARFAEGMPFFPQVLTVDTTIPEGRQLVLDVLTITEGVTLTVAGHLCVLSGIVNYGTLDITETGSFHNG